MSNGTVANISTINVDFIYLFAIKYLSLTSFPDLKSIKTVLKEMQISMKKIKSITKFTSSNYELFSILGANATYIGTNTQLKSANIMMIISQFCFSLSLGNIPSQICYL